MLCSLMEVKKWKVIQRSLTVGSAASQLRGLILQEAAACLQASAEHLGGMVEL